MPKRTVIATILILVTISILLTCNIQPVETKLNTSDQEKSPTSSHTKLADNGIRQNEKRSGDQVQIVEHRIETPELERLKRVIGVWQEGESSNQVINGHGTGLHPPTSEEWAEVAHETYFVDKVLLNEMSESVFNVDHTSKPWFPPIGDQDGEGSCVAWAVGYYTKTFQEAKEHEWDLSEARWEGGYYGCPTPEYQNRTISPDFIYHLINGGIDNGSSFHDAINLVCSLGASSWEKTPYDPHDHTSWPSEEAWSEAPFYRGNSSGYEYLELSTDEDLTSLKNWIASDHLAVIAVDGRQYTSLTSQDVWTLDNYADPELNHANTIVGYDDNLEYTEDRRLRRGAFKIVNSWGKGGWENVPDGCYWISYEAMKQRVGYTMFYRDRNGYQPDLVSSFRINHSKREECDILIGIGSHSDSSATKSFSDLIKGGNHPFCTNNILFDITEFIDVVPTVFDQPFFMEVYDGGSNITGTITYFSIEHAVSENPPVYTVNEDFVYADLVLPRTILVPDDYLTIQEAINAAVPRGTVFVRNGTYHEHVIVNKTICLTGENKKTTIIDGNGTGNAVFIDADNVNVSRIGILNATHGLFLKQCSNTVIKSLEFSNNSHGMHLHGCWFTEIRNNLIEKTANLSIFVSDSQNNLVINNVISWIGGCGVYLLSSTNNTVEDNLISEGYEGAGNGLLLEDSQKNLITNNTIMNNGGVGISSESSSQNSIYHNNFINNSVQIHQTLSNNTWDNGCEGNYWSKYNGTDSNFDGVGDEYLPWEGADHYPLMNLYWNPCDVNHDLIVDIKDILTAAKAYGSRPSHPNWNGHADITGPIYLVPDEFVDIRDIYLIAGSYGKTHP